MDLDERLEARANRIAAFFRSYPVAAAVAGIREHIEAFWTPAMRQRLGARADGGVGSLDPLVLQALRAPGVGAEAPGRSPTAGPREAGALGASDAG